MEFLFDCAEIHWVFYYVIVVLYFPGLWVHWGVEYPTPILFPKIGHNALGCLLPMVINLNVFRNLWNIKISNITRVLEDLAYDGNLSREFGYFRLDLLGGQWNPHSFYLASQDIFLWLLLIITPLVRDSGGRLLLMFHGRGGAILDQELHSVSTLRLMGSYYWGDVFLVDVVYVGILIDEDLADISTAVFRGVEDAGLAVVVH